MTTVAPPRLLDSADAITPAWLEHVLEHAGLAGAEVSGLGMSRIGAGNVGDTVRIAIAYAQRPPGAPGSVVCKFRCRDAMAHAHGVASGSYVREANAYRLLAARANPCATPRVLLVDGGADNINLVMEDLTQAARAGDQIGGCSPADAHAVVTELARLHRAFYPMPAAQAPDWALRMADVAEYWSGAIERALPLIHQYIGAQLSSADLRTLERAAMAAPAWYTLPVPRACFTHGDPRVDNILFREAGGSRAVLIDWQLAGWRNPMHDIGYFLSGSVSVADRRAHEHALLGDYAAMFAGHADYPPDQMREDYRVHLLSGLMTTMAAYSFVAITPAVAALLAALLGRNLAAANDWNSLGAVADVARNW